jgi:hypothetical protein
MLCICSGSWFMNNGKLKGINYAVYLLWQLVHEQW